MSTEWAGVFGDDKGFPVKGPRPHLDVDCWCNPQVEQVEPK